MERKGCSPMLFLQNDRLYFGVSETNGAIASLLDKKYNREYVVDTNVLPFRLEQDGQVLSQNAIFSYEQTPQTFNLRFELSDATLWATITLLSDGISFTSKLQNHSGGCYRAVEYPIIGGLMDLGEYGCLAHSYATGVLLHNPLSYLPGDGALRFTPYPESFSGASMQFFTYYMEGKGGLYFAAEDGEAHQKWLNCSAKDNTLEASLMVGFENVVPNSTIDGSFPFVLRLTDGDGWEEAATLYKEWAIQQSWCAQGPMVKRKEKPNWLFDEVGLTTFGINAGHDRTKWMDHYRQDVGTKVFHVLGPDWTNKPQTFYCGVPGGMADWVPTKFNHENLKDIADNGDFFAPFEFDFLVSLTGSDGDLLKENLQQYSDPTYSHDKYTFHMLCPCTEFTQKFHVDRDVQVLKEANVNAMYYDISANNLIKVCLSTDHGHHPGGGKAITDAYKEVYKKTRDALSDEAGKYIPLGTEMINEVYLPELDFYQARAWAQPCSTLETYPFRKQMQTGQAEMIPLFTYVYHEYGAVRMDGWGKLVDEIGKLFYHTAAKVYLWGGLYEINHEYSPMEAIDGIETSGQEHYFPFDPQNNEYSPNRAAYLSAFAAARTGKANRYWSYGKMRTTPKIDISKAKFNWYHYNHGQKDPSYKASGTICLPAVITSTWESIDGSIALFFANADDKPQTLTFSLDSTQLGLNGSPKTVRLLSGFRLSGEPQTMDLGVLSNGGTLPITLQVDAHELTMLEIE